MARRQRGTKTQVVSVKDISLILFCPFALMFFCSCAKEISTPPAVRSDVFQTAQDVLAGMHFSIEKADIQNGLVRTRPLPAAQFFEFWRSDNIGAENWAIANLHDIRRTVEIHITEQNGRKNIDCYVTIQRLSLPGRDVDSAARAYEMFSQSGPLLQTLQLGGSATAGMDWVSLGRDGRLEAEILRRIDRRIAPHKAEAKPSAKGQEI